MNIKSQTIKGFILIDFHTNLNQCYLLENYLTGYLDKLEKAISQKKIQKLNDIIDIKYQFTEKKK